MYYYLIETTFNELKRHGISIPFNQVEVRERVDEVVMPYIKDALSERVEKERPKNQRKVSIEDMEEGDLVSLSEAMKHSQIRSQERAKQMKEERKRKLSEVKAALRKAKKAEKKAN